MSGYDKFFKEANKATSQGARGAGPSKIKSSKPSFRLNAKSEMSAEDRLRQEIALRSRAKRKQAAKKKAKFPVTAAIVAVIAIVSCTVGFLKPDLVDQAFAHVNIGFLGQANASDVPKVDAKKEAKAEAPAKTAETKAAEPAKTDAPQEQAKSEVPADFRNWSDEELSFFNKLNDRKKALDLREAELNKLEEELQKQKAELDAKIKQLEAMRGDISKTLKTRVEVDQEKVDKLVQFYSTMKPPQAAKVIESINEDLAVEVMDKMKKKDAAAIMDALDPKKARRLSELLTGYQRSPASEAETTNSKEGD